MKMKQFKWIEFDKSGLTALPQINIDGKRYYQTKDGQKYPSVTTILASLPKATALVNWQKRKGEKEANKIMKKAGVKGHKIHKLAEQYILGSDEFNKLKTDPFALVNFNLIRPIIDEKIDNIYCTETPLFSDYLRAAGTVDLIAEFNKEPHIIDFKGAIKLRKLETYQNYYKQEAAYSVMFEERTGIKIRKGVVIFAVEQDKGYISEIDLEPFIHQFKKDRFSFYKQFGN